RHRVGELAFKAHAPHEVRLGIIERVYEPDAGRAVRQQAIVEQETGATPDRGEPVDGCVCRRQIALHTDDEAVGLPVVAELGTTDDALVIPVLDVTEMHAAVEALPDRHDWSFVCRRLLIAWRWPSEVRRRSRGCYQTHACGDDRRRSYSPPHHVHLSSSLLGTPASPSGHAASRDMNRT